MVLRDFVSGIGRHMGLQGGIKSIYYSTKYTDGATNLLLGKNVITEIADDATFDIESRVLFAVTFAGASHPNLGKSKLSVTNKGIFRAPTERGEARIGPCTVVHVEGEFSMGNSYINSHARVICEDHIEIGDDCAIAWNVELLDTDRHQLHLSEETPQKTAPIILEDRVWVGHNVTIKKGVTVGEGSVVASNSVVTRDVPEGSLVAGCPATVIEEEISWSP